MYQFIDLVLKANLEIKNYIETNKGQKINILRTLNQYF